MSKKLRNFLVFIIDIICTTALMLVIHNMSIQDENIYLVFVLSVLIVIVETKKLVYGILASMIFVMAFNFFITEPKYSFVVNNPNYYVSFFIFLLVALFVNSLVLQLQKQVEIAKHNENKVNTLYTLSTKYLSMKNIDQIYKETLNIISDYLKGYKCTIWIDDNRYYGEKISHGIYNEIELALKRNNVITSNESDSINGVIFPIRSDINCYGIIYVTPILNDDNIEFVKNAIEELIIILDKVTIYNQQQEAKHQIEKEKFKTSILRGLSHDMKTPLTMIQSGSNFINESYDKLSDNEKKGIISDIYLESIGLSNFVDNLLDMSKIQDDNLNLKFTSESVDDILVNVLKKMEKRLSQNKITIDGCDDVVMVYCEPSLLAQVFTNLIENAIKHTKNNTNIKIRYYLKDSRVFFEVIDDGGGISEDTIDKIFDDFYSLAKNQDKIRSNGLGLSICRDIVEAHGGHIMVYNNDIGGATFVFDIALASGGTHND